MRTRPSSIGKRLPVSLSYTNRSSLSNSTLDNTLEEDSLLLLNLKPLTPTRNQSPGVSPSIITNVDSLLNLKDDFLFKIGRRGLNF